MANYLNYHSNAWNWRKNTVRMFFFFNNLAKIFVGGGRATHLFPTQGHRQCALCTCAAYSIFWKNAKKKIRNYFSRTSGDLFYGIVNEAKRSSDQHNCLSQVYILSWKLAVLQTVKRDVTKVHKRKIFPTCDLTFEFWGFPQWAGGKAVRWDHREHRQSV